MIPAAPMIAALQASGTPFKFVGGAVDLVTASENLRTFPSAYVLPLRDSAGANQSAVYMASVQALNEGFGVMYAVRNVRPGAGADALEEMRLAANWARMALVGLQMDAYQDLVAFQGGELVTFADELMIWLDRFYIDSDLRKT